MKQPGIAGKNLEQCATKQRLKTLHFPPLTASKSTHTNPASAIYCTSTSPRLSPLLVLFTLRTFRGKKRKRKTLLSEKSPSGQKNFINKHVAGAKGQTTMLLSLDSLKKKKGKKKLPNVSAFVIRRSWWAPSDPSDRKLLKCSSRRNDGCQREPDHAAV